MKLIPVGHENTVIDRGRLVQPLVQRHVTRGEYATHYITREGIAPFLRSLAAVGVLTAVSLPAAWQARKKTVANKDQP